MTEARQGIEPADRLGWLVSRTPYGSHGQSVREECTKALVHNEFEKKISLKKKSLTLKCLVVFIEVVS